MGQKTQSIIFWQPQRLDPGEHCLHRDHLAYKLSHPLSISSSTFRHAQAWNIDWRKEEKRYGSNGMLGHSDMVLDLHHLESLDTIASASLDSNICIWDLYTGEKQQVLRGHKLGVLSLTYMPSQRFIISAGFDHEALVWSPFGSEKLFELKGHANSIVGVQRIGGSDSNEILTS